MKYLKTYESWESNFEWEDDYFYDYRDTEKPKVEIPESLEERCKKFIDAENKKGIEKGDLTYTINGDVVNVEGYFSLKLSGLDEIPIKFGEVKGSMFIDGDILTLKNAPEKVTTLNIRGCGKLKSLEGGPSYVKNWYHLPSGIESLEGLARPFQSGDSPKYNLSFPRYFTKSKLPDVLQTFIYRNSNDEFEITNEVYDDIQLFNDYDPLQGDKLILDRMNEFLDARTPEGHPLEGHMDLEDDKIKWLKQQGVKIV